MLSSCTISSTVLPLHIVMDGVVLRIVFLATGFRYVTDVMVHIFCYGEIADGNIINIAYKVNGGKVIPEDINYKEFLKDNGEVYPQQYSFHTLKAISCIKVLSCDMINNKKKYLNARGRR